MSNTLWSLALQLTNVVVAFAVPRAIIACYGSSVNGLVTSLTQFISYFNLVEAGISAAAIYALYKPLATNDIRAISVIVSAARSFYYKSGWFFVSLVAMLAFLYPLVVDCEGMDRIQVVILVGSLGAMGFLDYFTLAKYRVLLTASQRNWVIQIVTIGYKVLYATVIVSMSLAGFLVVHVYIAAVLPVLLRSMFLALYTKRAFPDVDYSANHRDYCLDQRWDAFYLQILSVVQAGAPIIIATFVLQDLSMVSVFSIYLLVANGVQNICSSLGNGTQATFGDVITKGQAGVLKQTFYEFQTLTYALNSFLTGVALCLVNHFVELFAGGVAEFNYVYPEIGFLAILNVFLYHLKTPQGLLVISAGMYKETRIQTTIQTLLLLIGALIGGLTVGIPGILLGCCISNVYRDIDLLVFVPRRITHTKIRVSLQKIGLSILELEVIAVPYFVIAPSCNSWIEWLIHAALLMLWGGLTCFVLSLAFDRKSLAGLFQRTKKLLEKKR